MFLQIPLSEWCGGTKGNTLPPDRRRRCTSSPTTSSSVKLDYSTCISHAPINSRSFTQAVICNVLLSYTFNVQSFWFDISAIATYDARGYLVWTLLGISFFLRSLYSKCSPPPNAALHTYTPATPYNLFAPTSTPTNTPATSRNLFAPHPRPLTHQQSPATCLRPHPRVPMWHWQDAGNELILPTAGHLQLVPQCKAPARG